LSDLCALGFVSVGTLLNIAGLWCAGRAFVHAWRAYGRGPLLPWLRAASEGVVALGRRLAPWIKRDATVHTATASASLKVSVSVRPVVRRAFPAGLTDSERIDRLVQTVEGIYSELTEDRAMADQQHSTLHRRIDEVAAGLRDESRRLEHLSKEAVSQDVRLQLAGLLLIGLGTVLATVPTILGLLAP